MGISRPAGVKFNHPKHPGQAHSAKVHFQPGGAPSGKPGLLSIARAAQQPTAGKKRGFLSTIMASRAGNFTHAAGQGGSSAPARTKTGDSGVPAQAASRRSRVHAQTRPSPARNRRPGLRVSLSRAPGRSGIGIN